MEVVWNIGGVCEPSKEPGPTGVAHNLQGSVSPSVETGRIGQERTRREGRSEESH